MQTVKEAILILSVIWIGLMVVSRIQKIYYEWQNRKTRKIYNDTIRMLSKRIQKMNEKGDKILIYIGDEVPTHTHPEGKEETHGTHRQNL
ncbi:hypothetical protein [Acidaminococcus timonensis]|uniref:hypothetical protein n=1 Tax=Acidaminococcus timonensis TaxID=1871002 RepID=UPI003078F7A2